MSLNIASSSRIEFFAFVVAGVVVIVVATFWFAVFSVARFVVSGLAVPDRAFYFRVVLIPSVGIHGDGSDDAALRVSFYACVAMCLTVDFKSKPVVVDADGLVTVVGGKHPL